MIMVLLMSTGYSNTGRKIDRQEVLQFLAKTYVGCKKHDKAIEVYKKILTFNPKDIEAHLELARLYSWKKKYEEAIFQDFEVLKLFPNNFEAMVHLAEVYKFAYNFEESKEWYRKCLKVYPDDPRLFIGLGEVFMWEGKYDEAIPLFQQALAMGKSENAQLLLGESFLYAGEVQLARDIFIVLVQKNPQDNSLKAYLAESYAYNKQFDEAVLVYRELIASDPSLFYKTRLAEVLSWKKDYKESLALYEEILNEKYDQETHRQKARVTGWAQEYTKAENEYKRILKIQYNKNIEIEMEAKVAYCNRKYLLAKKKYTELLSLEPDNEEARFDLCQLYGYTIQWEDAARECRDLLKYVPIHFRAKDELDKVNLIINKPFMREYFRSFKAFSVNRSTDINKRQWLNQYVFPCNATTTVEVNYNVARRWFIDYPTLSEKETLGRVTHIFGPESWIGGYYGVINYHKGEFHRKIVSSVPQPEFHFSRDHSSGRRRAPQQGKMKARFSDKHSSGRLVPRSTSTTTAAPLMFDDKLRHTSFHEYGAEFVKKDSDYFSYSLRYDKARLENDAAVIVKSLYQKAWLGRFNWTYSRNLVCGMDYKYSKYSDGNTFYQPGADATWIIKQDPERLYVTYRYFWMNYKKMAVEYWTPQHLSTNGMTIGWRHDLNKGEVYFGMLERYLDLQYEVTRDSTQVIENRFRWNVTWELTKKVHLNVGGSVLRSNHHDVYKENEMFCEIKWYF
jgi:tetratricopeptide (TPR) repeat protein